MIVITGATGALNGATADHLLERVPPAEVVVAVRDVDTASRFTERGVEVRRADYADATSLPAAFAGADQLLLVSTGDPGVDAVALHRTAIEAAVTAGVGRILYTSHQGAGLDNPFPPARTHAATEQLLAESGVPWTALRNGFYAHSLHLFLGPWRETGVIGVPADGPVSWTAREDAAEAAAVIIASNGAFDGPLVITAGSALTFTDVAAAAAEIVGRTVEAVVMGEAAWVEAHVARGHDEGRARFMLAAYRAASEGRFAGVDPLLATLLGREPRTVKAVLAASAS